MLDDEISTVLVVNNTTKASFNLLGNAEIVEDRHLTGEMCIRDRSIPLLMEE